jgi:hypothetical protein
MAQPLQIMENGKMMYEVRWLAQHPITLTYHNYFGSGLDVAKATALYNKQKSNTGVNVLWIEVWKYDESNRYTLVRAWQKGVIC